MSQTAQINPLSVRVEVSKHLLLKQRLLEEFPDLDDTTLGDTLEGASELREMLAAVMRSSLDDDTLVDSLGRRLTDMRLRLERLRDAAQKKRDLVLAAMQDASIPKLVEPDFTVSVRRGAQGFDVICEENIPPNYWKPQPAKLDRVAVLNHLKAGICVQGAKLVPAKMQLSVRTK